MRLLAWKVRVPAWLLVALVLAAPTTGCKKKTLPTPVPVKGRVVDADGKPLDRLILFFHPSDKENQVRIPPAVAVNNGRFETKCLPGRYKVTLGVIPAGGHNPMGGGALADPGKGDNPQLESIPLPYRKPDTSPWEVSIPASGKDDLELRVQWHN
jgi:hypothetical protein